MRRIKEAARNGKNESREMKSAMSVCMDSLRKIGGKSTSPEVWVDMSGKEERSWQ